MAGLQSVVDSVADLRRARIRVRITIVAVIGLAHEDRIVDTSAHHAGRGITEAVAIEIAEEDFGRAFVERAVAVLVDAVAGFDGLRRHPIATVVAVLTAAGAVAAFDRCVAIAVFVTTERGGIAILVVTIEIAEFGVAGVAVRIAIVAVVTAAVDRGGTVAICVAGGAVDGHAAHLRFAAFLSAQAGVGGRHASGGVGYRVGRIALLDTRAEKPVRAVRVGHAHGSGVWIHRRVVAAGGEQEESERDPPSHQARVPESPGRWVMQAVPQFGDVERVS